MKIHLPSLLAAFALLAEIVAFLTLPFCLLTGCAGGRYIGPSIGISGGYEGATVGVTLYGENPVSLAAEKTVGTGPVQLSTGSVTSPALPAATP